MTAALFVQGLQVAIGTGASSANVLRGVSLDLQRGEAEADGTALAVDDDRRDRARMQEWIRSQR